MPDFSTVSVNDVTVNPAWAISRESQTLCRLVGRPKNVTGVLFAPSVVVITGVNGTVKVAHEVDQELQRLDALFLWP